MGPSKYNPLLGDNDTSVYNKTDNNLAKKINKEAKVIATNLKIEDRVETYPDRRAFITLKDHKSNFIDNLKCRLNNPAKSEIGEVRKAYLDDINRSI